MGRLAQMLFQGFQGQALVIHGQAAEPEMGRLEDLERFDICRIFDVDRRPATEKAGGNELKSLKGS